MGDQLVHHAPTTTNRAVFIRHLLDDIRALELMVQDGKIETGITRIGAEQEFCLLDHLWRPAGNALEILAEIDDPHFTTELALYNLEINLDPHVLHGHCFSTVEQQLTNLLEKATRVAGRHNSRIILNGILPTIGPRHLREDYLTPKPRYHALNTLMRQARGRDFEVYLRGVDQLAITLDSVLFEACNTSFQLHLQVCPRHFVPAYNWAQAISGPVLSLCTNSPLLLGRELWSETRIALFQQSVDTRSSSYALQDKQPRVTFGDQWLHESIAEIYKHDLSCYKVMLTKEIRQSSLDVLEAGGVPGLEALNLHNGSIYRWNRACYGVGGGTPHVRIENRYLPSGPTVADEMANFAFWTGLMTGRPSQYDDLPALMDFREAKANFFKAARTGMDSVLSWCGESVPAKDLARDILIPLARQGLAKHHINQQDIDRYLGIIEARLSGNDGSRWMIKNYRNLNRKKRQDDALKVLTKAIHHNQQTNQPVHTWPEVNSTLAANEAAQLVGHVMSTRLLTVTEEDLADLAIKIMQWNDIHHLPVEDQKGSLCGLLTWTNVAQYIEGNEAGAGLMVKDIMVKEVYTATYEMSLEEASSLMEEKAIGCLPVINREHMVGIVTRVDLSHFSND
ncbi:CBS domain-containing protein [Roseivirga sp. BDSF3-8]|uniref:CBS domain-containing protein n=1 Tax=Roseivirga sp. BDSF3-8 TaxID=3241598 RepID=UPI003531D29B